MPDTNVRKNVIAPGLLRKIESRMKGSYALELRPLPERHSCP